MTSWLQQGQRKGSMCSKPFIRGRGSTWLSSDCSTAVREGMETNIAVEDLENLGEEEEEDSYEAFEQMARQAQTRGGRPGVGGVVASN